MRILFVTAYVPSPIRVRPYQLVRGLARRGHEVTVSTLYSDRGEYEHASALGKCQVEVISHPMPLWRSFCNCLGALPRQVPLQSVYSWNPMYARLLNNLVRRRDFDVVHVDHLRAAAYGPQIAEGLNAKYGGDKRRPPIVWDSVDCISLLLRRAKAHTTSLAQRYIMALELPRTEQFERSATARFDNVLVTTASDAKAMVEIASAHASGNSPEVSVLGNGVDLDCFRPDEGPRQQDTLIFTGKMSYHANVAAARYLVSEIMPRVWTEKPNVELFIVGKNPPKSIRQLQHHRSTVNPSSGHPRVKVIGAVPNLQPYLSRAAVAVAPMVYGVGIQNKVLEAMACGTPVVASPVVASGIAARAGEEYLTGSDASSFAFSVLRLLKDAGLRNRLGQAGRRYVESCHDWSHVSQQLESLYMARIPNRSYR